jgi:glycogen debranching enzyme
MKLIDVDLNSLYALDCFCLSKIADIIGRKKESKKLLKEYQEIKKRINKILWNEKLGIYLNRHWNGKFSYILSPTLFYPLIAGIPEHYQAEKVVKTHLLNEREFWGKFVLPSISRNHKSFKENNYWRGRIWAPMNFLVWEGLKRYKFYKESYILTIKSLRLLKLEWNNKSHIHENYNSVNGKGCDVLNSESVYTWTALLAYLGVGEIINYQVWDNKITFASPYLKGEKVLKNCKIGNSIYNVFLKNKNIKVLKNGKTFKT